MSASTCQAKRATAEVGHQLEPQVYLTWSILKRDGFPLLFLVHPPKQKQHWTHSDPFLRRVWVEALKTGVKGSASLAPEALSSRW